jgi:hypothetical protein
MRWPVWNRRALATSGTEWRTNSLTGTISGVRHGTTGAPEWVAASPFFATMRDRSTIPSFERPLFVITRTRRGQCRAILSPCLLSAIASARSARVVRRDRRIFRAADQIFAPHSRFDLRGERRSALLVGLDPIGVRAARARVLDEDGERRGGRREGGGRGVERHGRSIALDRRATSWARAPVPDAAPD